MAAIVTAVCWMGCAWGASAGMASIKRTLPQKTPVHLTGAAACTGTRPEMWLARSDWSSAIPPENGIDRMAK